MTIGNNSQIKATVKNSKNDDVKQISDVNPEDVNVGDMLADGDMTFTVLNNNVKEEVEEKPKTTRKRTTKKTTEEKAKTTAKKTTTRKTTKKTTDIEEKPKTTRKRTTKAKDTEEKPKTTRKKSTTKKTTKKVEEAINELQPVVIQVGDKRNYFYYKLIFTNVSQNADLLCMAIKDGSGNIFYAENIGCDVTTMDPDIFSNVFKNMITVKDKSSKSITSGDKWFVFGNEDEISLQFMLWLTDKEFEEDHKRVQFVGDKCTLEFTRLLKMMTPKGQDEIEIPQAISPISIELNQELARVLTFPRVEEISEENWNRLFIPDIETYYQDRRELLQKVEISVKDDGIYAINEVNVIEALFKWIWNLQ